MDSFTLFVAILSVVALVIQGCSCLSSPERKSPIGVLDLGLAGLAIYMIASMRSGQLVVAEDFGSLMVEGWAGAWMLRVALIGACILPGLCVYQIRQLKQTPQPKQRERTWPCPLWAVLLIGFLVGLIAAWNVRAMNPSDPEILHVYQYDVWYPPVVVWFTLCLAGSMLTLAEELAIVVLVVFSALWLTVMGRFALYYEDLPGRGSHLMWAVLVPLSFALSMLIFFRERSKNAKSRTEKLLSFGIGGAVVVVFVLLPSLIQNPRTAFLAQIWFAAAVFAVFLVAVAYDAARQKKRLLSGVLISLALPIVAASLIDIFSIGGLSLALDLIIFFVFWIYFAEALAQGLERFPKFWMHVEPWVDRSKTALCGFGATVHRGLKWLFEGSAAAVIMKTLIFPVVIFLGLIIVDEALNFKKIVVEPFQWTGVSSEENSKSTAAKEETTGESKSEASDKAVSQAITLGVVNALGQFRLDLRQELIIASRKPSGEHVPSVSLFAAGIDAGSASTSVANTSRGELEISGFKLPVEFIVAPARHLARVLLHIEVVDGSVHKSAAGRYIVMANSSAGGSWRETGRKPADSGKAESNLADSDGGSGEEDSCFPNDPQVLNAAGPASDEIADLVERVAFDIASNDPAFIDLGLTRDRVAFERFRAGLRSWSAFQRGKDFAELNRAITWFRAAICRDHSFALAYYRLGLALQRDAQPKAAVEAFRASFEANPRFIPAATLAANTLHDLAAYYPGDPAAVTFSQPHTPLKEQAAKLFTELTQLPAGSESISERRTAYLGVCLYEFDREKESGAVQFYLPYYYCRRAEALYYQLPAQERKDTAEQGVQARILDTVGASLDSHNYKSWQLPNTGGLWYCTDSAVQPNALKADGSVESVSVGGSMRSWGALHYYRKSLELNPDDPIVECNEANASTYVSGGDLTAMNALERDSKMHSSVASSFAQDARYYNADPCPGREKGPCPDVVAGYYRLALQEYKRAAQLDVASVDAANDFANTYWLWHVAAMRNPERFSQYAPSEADAHEAERYAREAVNLAWQQESQEYEMEAHDTLGEVLLAQGRLQEAMQHLESATKLDRFAPGIDEVFWDLAQAQICAANSSKDPEKKRYRLDAMKTLEQLRTRELTNEWRPYLVSEDTWLRDTLDVSQGGLSCGAPESKTFQFVMREPGRVPNLGCSYPAAMVKVLGAGDMGSSYIHIWGEGVDDRTPLDRQRSIWLADGAEPADRYFVARLEDQKGNPLSAAQQFVVRPTAKGKCADWVQLTFEDMSNKHGQ